MDVRELALDIARELRENPAAWHQGEFDNAHGGLCPTAWCLSGHMDKRGFRTLGPEYTRFMEAAGETVCCWNDKAGRTVQEVIELCEKVAAAA